ncbi:MAG: imidazole glycerol phosphate synthase subunit HisH [Gammaproteobacteria bacterium]|nr:imidazole glycerol phosphate synthase subunit HisH [Gammaproteobacteria bacterium]MCP4831359.1 imidazole glycerol phosphate synthase subunit HisH [Gammaproteobacteria bacterium]
MPEVAIIDGGGANIASLRFALKRLGADSELTTDPDTIRAARRVILPGVGAAADAMEKLRSAGLDKVIPALTQPLLGICLGMQLLFDSSEEEDATCLGIIEGRAHLFDIAQDQPVPHMGWNRVKQTRNTVLFNGIPDGAYFYFVHSYALDTVAATTGRTSYGRNFTSVVHQGNFMGAQFHPERSGKYGARLLQNFLEQND